MPDSSKIDDEISQFDGNNKKRSYGSINSKNIRSLDKHDVKSE